MKLTIQLLVLPRLITLAILPSLAIGSHGIVLTHGDENLVLVLLVIFVYFNW
jgi:hypothetical protein